jgi:hypothetical protein
MKKVIGLFLVVLVGFAVLAQADGYRSVSLTVTNGQAITLSDAIPVFGVLEKIEIVQTVGCTATVAVATFSGTTAVDTLVSLTSLVGNKVVRPRIIGTTTAGVNLAASVQAGSDALTNLVSTALVGLYEKPIVGGNLKLAVTAGAATQAANTVEARLYFTPLVK